MSASSNDRAPARHRGNRDSTVVVHRALREAILRSDIPAGAWLSQVQIAKQFGVSRGPVREALRLLEREGLIEAEVNHRARVTHFSIEDLEQLYASRIVTEALSIAVSVPRFSDHDLEELQRMLEELEALQGVDIERWEEVHREFHLALVAHAGDRMLRLIEQFIDHSERYRRVYITQGPRSWTVGAAEHQGIVAACVERDPVRASVLLAQHLSRTALTVFMLVAPEHNPETIRAALRQASDPEFALPDPVASARRDRGEKAERSTLRRRSRSGKS
jgi:DNA-binding GntR family transcriptional regulator